MLEQHAAARKPGRDFEWERRIRHALLARRDLLDLLDDADAATEAGDTERAVELHRQFDAGFEDVKQETAVAS